jgi:hypothetical protein
MIIKAIVKRVMKEMVSQTAYLRSGLETPLTSRR